MLRLCLFLLCLSCCGCSIFPQIAYQPTVHNPFPQLSKVAIAPFFNLSEEPTLDGRQFASAYFNELQSVPGFEVVPVGVVERAMLEHQIALTGPDEARRLAQLLEVDALVIGAVTDYSPYYPPRCAMLVEWYAASPCFHPIPPGYGLPWGTPEELDIPGSLIFEAEMALAREQLKTQSPAYGPEVKTASGQTTDKSATASPTEWPDPRGFISPPPTPVPPVCIPTVEPVLKHTRTYNGHDADFTEALQTYYFFRDDARFGGWQGYLQRSEDFIRFCCHMHIWEMLSARGGAGETRVVWRWPIIR
jgi:hypothetical protein